MENKPNRGPGRPPKPKKMPVKLLKGYMPLQGTKKLPKDSVSELPIDEAKMIIEAGLAERADPLPA